MARRHRQGNLLMHGRPRLAAGARMSGATTAKVLHEKLAPETWNFARWICERLGGGINRLAALLRLPLRPLRRLRQQKWQGARSCNLAVWRFALHRLHPLR